MIYSITLATSTARNTIQNNIYINCNANPEGIPSKDALSKQRLDAEAEKN